ncbi:MAG TPA: sodium-dependent transporter, partial [Metalysinibacillus sp.]
FTLLIGLPMLLSEYIIGRNAQAEAVTAYKKLAPNTSWVWLGRMGVIGCFLLLTFYSVVGGWITLFTGYALTGGLIGDGIDAGQIFGAVTSTPSTTLFGLALFTLANVVVISLGVQNGIEKMNKIMMPLLFVLFIVLVGRALTLDGAMEGVKFFLYPDFSKTTGESLLYALGQSFFALAVGMSCLVTYSSYLKKDVSLPQAASSVVALNILVSLLAGLAIFPVVFATGLEATAGPELLFIVLPAAFGQMPFGEIFLALFLVLFLFATLTSSFSLYEIIVAALVEKFALTRAQLTMILGVVVFIAAIPSALTSSILSDVTIFGKNIFDATDFLVSNIILPIGNLLIAIFVIHVMKRERVKAELLQGSNVSPSFYKMYRVLMTYVVPVAISIVILYTIYEKFIV